MRIKDVAKLTGVSAATVSHVINNRRFVTAETRQKVQVVGPRLAGQSEGRPSAK